jgi:hypothetical protein
MREGATSAIGIIHAITVVITSIVVSLLPNLQEHILHETYIAIIPTEITLLMLLDLLCVPTQEIAILIFTLEM